MHTFPMPVTRLWVAGFLLLILLAGCAPTVKVRSDVDPTVDLRAYDTFGFFSQLGIEGNDYANLLGQHFRSAISREMTARGYQPAGSAQLQVNVSASADEKIRVNTYQDPYLYGGHYGRFYDPWMGGPWYGGGTHTTVHQYTEAQVYIDLVDAAQHKLVWQGVATFTLSEKMQKDPRTAVYNTVAEVFKQFPVAPATAP